MSKRKAAVEVTKTQPRRPIEFKTEAQRDAYASFKNNDVLFLLGPAGVGKSYLAMALALREYDEKRAERIVITRPIVESEESLGYLPGDMREKTDPYMAPLHDQVSTLRGEGWRANYQQVIQTVPLAYMRGRTFTSSICVFDEAQNANMRQFKLYLSRLGDGSKMIITGDPSQVDIRDSALTEVVKRICNVDGVAVHCFRSNDIVRHPVVERILQHLPE